MRESSHLGRQLRGTGDVSVELLFAAEIRRRPPDVGVALLARLVQRPGGIGEMWPREGTKSARPAAMIVFT